MKHYSKISLSTTLALVLTYSVLDQAAETATAVTQKAPGRYLSPTALVVSPDAKKLFIACATGNAVLVFDLESNRIVREIPVPASPLGLAWSADATLLYVTCGAPQSKISIIDAAAQCEVASIRAGHTAMAPVLSPDGKTLYVCDRFDNEVVFIDLASRTVLKRVAVPREPVAAALTVDGKFLLVANHIHSGRSDVAYVASSVTVIDTVSAKVAKELALPNGSGLLRDVRVSPDGKYACVTHLISRFHMPTTQIERGWINSNALTLIDLGQLTVINSVLLDNVDSGAANPWGLAWSVDSKTICVTHAGSHELSVINLPALMEKLAKLAAAAASKAQPSFTSASRSLADVPNDLAFMVGVRKRIKLSESDRGPRAVALVGTMAYVANYFTDTISRVDLALENPRVESIPLACATPLTQVRRGELLFNDASICFQGWQTCGSCHSSDARVDGLNWDNLNDGIGNPKNVKSLLLAHQTPPSMAMGVRETAEDAVRAGIRHSLFTVRPEEDAVALDEYLKSLQPIPSPYLVNSALSPAAARGKILFFDETVGCADCHRPPLFTNLKTYDVGTAGKFDRPTDKFDTPTLVELWRTAPYLHDGRAATVKETVTIWNKEDRRGKTSHLSEEQIDDLVAYLLSL